MDAFPSQEDRDARLLGLALLHGYLGATALKSAAMDDPHPSSILKHLRETGVLDEPCLHGLEQGLREFGESPTQPESLTSATQAFPGEAGPGSPRSSWNGGGADDPSGILRKLTIARWKQYRHLRFIGEGGMGRIFKAVDPDLNRTVALKFLRGQDPGQLRRFLFEAQAQALVDHPNICQVHEVNEWQGQHYIAMQYVNGPTLAKVAAEFTVEQKLQVMEAVALAVHAAHRRGLIHRDVKPTNILVEKEEDGSLKPFVLDFGLARDLEFSDFTASGQVVGTTAYMAPEQARGESHHIDRRTDVYGLGATLYQVFTGEPPFGQAKGMECVQMVLGEEPPPLRRLAPHLHPDLETIVAKCLEKEPNRRYDNAQALAEDLRRFLAGDPILARPVTFAYRVGKFARKNRPLVIVSAAALGAVLLAGGVAAYARINANARELAAQHFGQEAERIEALLGYARRLPLQDIEPRIEQARQRLARLQEEAARSSGAGAGPGALAVGRVLLAFGDIDEALPRLREAQARGLHAPELDAALGRCYAAVYQRELERARRAPSQSPQDQELREARIHQVEQQWREPALRHLRLARLGSPEPQESLEALLDSYEGRLEEALAKVRAVTRKDPSVYEAKGLEGDFLLAQARLDRERPDFGAARVGLEAARACYRDALAVAPCDETLRVGEAKCLVEALRMEGGEAQGSALLAACREAVAGALRARPHDPTPLAQVATALYWTGTRRYYAKVDPEPALREGLALSALVLAQAPANYDAHFARIGLLQILGRWQRNIGKDPTETLAEAQRAAEQALAQHRGDWGLLVQATMGAQDKLIWEGLAGKDIEASFQLALGLNREILALYPTHPNSHFRAATLLEERAEHERTHGRDPGHAVASAREHLEKARLLGLDPGLYHYVMGDCALIQGQHALALEQEASPHLDQALDHYGQRTKLARPGAETWAVYGEACFCKALDELRKGRDPGPWIARMDAALAEALAIGSYYWITQLQGQSEWLKARLDLRHGRDPQPRFALSLRALDRALAMATMASTYRWAARVQLDRAQCPGAPPGSLALGIRAAEAALAKDPGSGEAALLLGQLKLLGAEALTGARRTAQQAEGKALVARALLMNENLRRRAERPLRSLASGAVLDP